MICDWCGRGYNQNESKYKKHINNCKAKKLIDAAKRAILTISNGEQLEGDPFGIFICDPPLELKKVLQDYVKLKFDTSADNNKTE